MPANSRSDFSRAYLFLILTLIVMCATTLQAGPDIMNYSGRLLDNSGHPVATPATATFSFYDSPGEGQQLGNGYAYQATVTPNDDGLYSIEIGHPVAGTGGFIPADIFDAPAAWLNVNINGEDLTPRAPLNKTPYAFSADKSAQADNATTAAAALQALGLTGTAFVTTETTGSWLENGISLLAAYEKAKTLTPNNLPLSATNRAAVIVLPGQYYLQNTFLELDTEFVDVIGLTTARENQMISGISGEHNGDLCLLLQTANDVHIENLTISPTMGAAYYPDAPSTEKTVIKNCYLIPNIGVSMRGDTDYAGTYINVTAGQRSFGYWGDASGTFIDCTAGIMSFAYAGTASGTFINCEAGEQSFAPGGEASGTFIDCTAGALSFGHFATGTFRNCTAGYNSFASSHQSEASGTFLNCVAGRNSFGGGGGLASGAFSHCIAERDSFGGPTNNGSAAGGKFKYCEAGPGSFHTDAAEILYCIRDGQAYP